MNIRSRFDAQSYSMGSIVIPTQICRPEYTRGDSMKQDSCTIAFMPWVSLGSELLVGNYRIWNFWALRDRYM